MKDLVSSAKSWDYETALENALREREELLKNNPELKAFQSKIDKTLSETDIFEEKMKLLGKMIGSNLNLLYDKCHTLSEICSEIGIEANLPILEIKTKVKHLSGEPVNK